MELWLLLTISCIFVVVVVVWAWEVLKWIWLTPKRVEKIMRQQGFRGNPYTAFYGGQSKETSDLVAEATSKPITLSHDIVSKVMPHVLITFQTYGKKSYMWDGRMPKVLIFDPELVREILANHTVFVKNWKIKNPLTKFLLNGVASYEGEKWARHRRIINPSFHMEKIKLMVPAFYASYECQLSKWEKECEMNGSCEVDVFPTFDTLTSDVISRTAFGSSYDEGRLIFILLKEQTDLTLEAMQSLYIPGLSVLPTKKNNRMRAIEKELRSILTTIINKRLETMKAGEGKNDDFLGTLLQSTFNENQEGGNKKRIDSMSIDDVIEECKLFYFAGQETTSVLLVWTMVLLSIHPEWQDRARQEILQVFGDNKPDFDGLNHLKVVNMILYEVLRLYPPAVLMTRTIHEETNLGNMTLPVGVQLSLPIILIHHDTEIWGSDAKEFKPERFSDGISKATKGQQVAYFPFSWGPRICIGQNFAMLEAKMALALILQRFSFELSTSYCHAPYTLITLQPQHGAHLCLRRL